MQPNVQCLKKILVLIKQNTKKYLSVAISKFARSTGQQEITIVAAFSLSAPRTVKGGKGRLLTVINLRQ